MDEQRVIAKQLKRRPLTAVATAVLCHAGFPLVLENGPLTHGGAPFPTLYWLSCPALCRAVSKLEAEGSVGRLTARVAANERLRERLERSDKLYRRRRAAASPGEAFPGGDVGIAGARDVAQLKCLHAHLADYLAAGVNPIGELVLQAAPVPADCAVCADL
jgi:uncharacterized protein